MHPHLLLTTADAITRERLARAAQRRLVVRRRRRAMTLDGVGARLVGFGAAARRAGSVGTREVEPVGCAPSS